VYIKIITSYTGGTVFETQCRYFSHVCTQFVQILKLEQESANGKQLNSDQVLCVIYTVNSDWLLCVSECDFHHWTVYITACSLCDARPSVQSLT